MCFIDPNIRNDMAHGPIFDAEGILVRVFGLLHSQQLIQIFCAASVRMVLPYARPVSNISSAQTVVFNFGSFLLTGITAVFTISTAKTVFGVMHDSPVSNLCAASDR